MAPQGGTTETDISSQSAKGDERKNEHLRSRFSLEKSYVGALLPSVGDGVWGGEMQKPLQLRWHLGHGPFIFSIFGSSPPYNCDGIF